MWPTCKYRFPMPTMIQLRHVPDALVWLLGTPGAVRLARRLVGPGRSVHAPLLTADGKLGRSHGHDARVEVFEP